MNKLMMKLKLFAAVAAGVVALGANGETFLKKLAADAPQYKTAEEAAGKTIKYIWYHHKPTGFAIILR